jgi:hypothetical protein
MLAFWLSLCDCLVSELKERDLQSIMAWSLEDALANYDVSKNAIESQSENFEGILADGDVRALAYLIDVYRYCANIATTKQVMRL